MHLKNTKNYEKFDEFLKKYVLYKIRHDHMDLQLERNKLRLLSAVFDFLSVKLWYANRMYPSKLKIDFVKRLQRLKGSTSFPSFLMSSDVCDKMPPDIYTKYSLSEVRN